MTEERDSRAFRYEHCDIPAGMTIGEWRAAGAKDLDARPRARHMARRLVAAAIAQLSATRQTAPRRRREARA